MVSENSYSPPHLCAYGCGFFGSALTNNLCSQCYKIYLKQEQEEEQKLVSNLSSQSISSSCDYLPNNSLKLTIDNQLTPPEGSTTNNASCSETIDTKVAKKKTRCESCNKKMGLTGFECRCGHVFCGFHRYPKEHSCTFDFKKLDLEVLVKQNPLFKIDKLESRV